MTPAAEPKVTAVVVTFNRKELLREALAALAAQERPVDRVLVIDNASTDGTPEQVRAENQALYKRYEALADATPNVTFVGRLATYRYYNMDQVVGQALSAFAKLAAAGRMAAETPR